MARRAGPAGGRVAPCSGARISCLFAARRNCAMHELRRLVARAPQHCSSSGHTHTSKMLSSALSAWAAGLLPAGDERLAMLAGLTSSHHAAQRPTLHDACNCSGGGGGLTHVVARVQATRMLSTWSRPFAPPATRRAPPSPSSQLLGRCAEHPHAPAPSDGNPSMRSGGRLLQVLAQEWEANAKGRIDDITCVVLFLDP